MTRCDARSREVRQTITEIKAAAAKMKTEVLEPPIRATIKVQSAQRAKRNLLDYAPKSTAALDYMEIVKQLLN